LPSLLHRRAKKRKNRRSGFDGDSQYVFQCKFDAEFGDCHSKTLAHGQESATELKGEKMKISKVVRVAGICFCLAMISQFAHSESNKPRPVTGTSNASKSDIPPIVRLNKSSLSVGCVNFIDGVCLGGTPGPLMGGVEYRGPCPIRLIFDWSIVSAQPTSVTYSLQKSDGSPVSTVTKINLPKGNTPVDVIDMWVLGANTPEFRNYRGWMDLSTLTPNVFGKKINFALRCNQGN
jgi:hypothetical protein